MERGNKEEGVRQDRPLPYGRVTTEILREADRIVKERLKEGRISRKRAFSPILAFLGGILTATVFFTVLQILAGVR